MVVATSSLFKYVEQFTRVGRLYIELEYEDLQYETFEYFVLVIENNFFWIKYASATYKDIIEFIYVGLATGEVCLKP